MQPSSAVRILFSVFVWFSIQACGSESKDDSSAQSESGTAAHDSVVIELVGQDSMTVLDLLKAAHDVEFRSTAAGAFVVSIDSIGGGGAYWVYVVNDSQPNIASDKMFTRSGDRVTWHLRVVRP